MSYVLLGELSATTSRMFCERLATVTPLRRTSSGRRGVASCTRLLTLKVALSMSVPTSKVAVMEMVGGEISGYWAIGKIDADTNPASTMMMASTLAKMGRSMKNLDMGSFLPLVAGWAGAWASSYCLAGAAPGLAAPPWAPLAPPGAAPPAPAPGPPGPSPGACGATGAPGRSFMRLSMMSLSPGASPLVITQSLPDQPAVSTGLGTTLLSGETVKTTLP